MAFLNFDLAGAEWVIVAYLCQDENMLRVVSGKTSPHVITGSLMTGAPQDLVEREHKIVGEETDQTVIAELRKQVPELFRGNYKLPRTMSIRQAGKKANHGLNYGMQYRLFSMLNEIPEPDAKEIVWAYSNRAYPRLPEYWRETQKTLRNNNRTLENCFGRRVRLLDEWGPELWMAAYAFVPQSTVADCVLEAMVKLYHLGIPARRNLYVGANVHDSLLVEYPSSDLTGMAEVARAAIDALTPELEYRGNRFRLRADAKIGLSWGEMAPVADLSPEGLRMALEGIPERRAAA